jgi:hypothetical protein
MCVHSEREGGQVRAGESSYLRRVNLWDRDVDPIKKNQILWSLPPTDFGTSHHSIHVKLIVVKFSEAGARYLPRPLFEAWGR